MVRELAKIAFATLQHCIHIDDAGQPVINFAHTPHDTIDALLEVSTETILKAGGDSDGPYNVRKTKIRLADKLRALEMLARHTGVYFCKNKQKATDLAILIDH